MTCLFNITTHNVINISLILYYFVYTHKSQLLPTYDFFIRIYKFILQLHRKPKYNINWKHLTPLPLPPHTGILNGPVEVVTNEASQITLGHPITNDINLMKSCWRWNNIRGIVILTYCSCLFWRHCNQMFNINTMRLSSACIL